MTEHQSAEIRELKQQVAWLTRLVIFMAVITSVSAGLLPMALMSLFSLLLLLPILAFTHHWIPPVARQIGRLFSYFRPQKQAAI